MRPESYPTAVLFIACHLLTLEQQFESTPEARQQLAKVALTTVKHNGVHSYLGGCLGKTALDSLTAFDTMEEPTRDVVRVMDLINKGELRYDVEWRRFYDILPLFYTINPPLEPLK